MQKEQLSALMDGELVDNELIGSLSQDDQLRQHWFRYHLIRDSLRGDTEQFIHVDIASNVLAAIDSEERAPVTLIPEAQPKPEIWHKMPFWQKVKPWFSNIGQAGVAAGVSLAVIVGVQQYNSGVDTVAPQMPAFNTFAIGSLASPVSYDTSNSAQPNTQDHRRHFALLQDYELQRRLHAEPLNLNALSQTAPVQQNENVKAVGN
jgi:sigma-E factor negative regulatory protein RseA